MELIYSLVVFALIHIDRQNMPHVYLYMRNIPSNPLTFYLRHRTRSTVVVWTILINSNTSIVFAQKTAVGHFQSWHSIDHRTIVNHMTFQPISYVGNVFTWYGPPYVQWERRGFKGACKFKAGTVTAVWLILWEGLIDINFTPCMVGKSTKDEISQ